MVVGGGAISYERGTPVVDRVDPEPSTINDGASERERERAREREGESEKERERGRKKERGVESERERRSDVPSFASPSAALTRMPRPLSVQPSPCTLHPTFYTLHPAPCTLHPTPYTLHPAPYTLDPTPCTLRPSSPEYCARMPPDVPNTNGALPGILRGNNATLTLRALAGDGPQKAVCGGIPGSFLEPLVRSWSHFVGIYRQKLTRSLEN